LLLGNDTLHKLGATISFGNQQLLIGTTSVSVSILKASSKPNSFIIYSPENITVHPRSVMTLLCQTKVPNRTLGMIEGTRKMNDIGFHVAWSLVQIQHYRQCAIRLTNFSSDTIRLTTKIPIATFEKIERPSNVVSLSDLPQSEEQK
jgi:hypothetical protein